MSIKVYDTDGRQSYNNSKAFASEKGGRLPSIMEVIVVRIDI